MPTLKLCDDELQDAAQAARVASVQAEQDAERQSSPKIRAMFDNAARRFRELADMFEKARRSPSITAHTPGAAIIEKCEPAISGPRLSPFTCSSHPSVRPALRACLSLSVAVKRPTWPW